MSIETSHYEPIFFAHFLTINNLLSSVSDSNFEFGDNPTSLRNVQEKLSSIQQNILALQKMLSIEKDGLAIMNPWFKLTKQLKETLEWIEHIERKNSGSRKQTQKLQEFLQGIDNQLHEVYATVSPIQ